MRPAVKKPSHHHAPHHKKEAPKPDIAKTPHERLRRAGEIKKSPLIRRFHLAHEQPGIIKRGTNLPVIEKKPEHDHKQAVEPNIIQQSIHESIDQFERAMHNSTAHLETYAQEHTPKRFRKLAFTTAGVSLAIILSFVTYQAIPTAKVKLAGNKAGFSAGLPDYSPAGYGLSGDIVATSGKVTLAYDSRTDTKSYKLEQQPSNWNSQALANNFLLAERKAYKTYEANGKTVYIYEETNATWVDGGVWYKIEGDATLTSDQLLRIANGL